MRRIVDTFLFCHELDILELRLNILDPVVDLFVLCESTNTFTRKAKPLFFAENEKRFSKWKGRIRHVLFRDTSKNDDPWLAESDQRRSLAKGLPSLQSSDVVIHSDVDEIPRPEIIKQYDPAYGIKCLGGYNAMFYLNTELVHQPWVGPKIFPHGILRRVDFSQIRHYNAELWCHVWPNSAWHFSYCGGVSALLFKVGAYGHSKEIKPETHDRAIVEQVLKNPTKPRSILPGQPIVARKVDSSFPSYVKQNMTALRSKGLLWNC